MSKKIVRGYFFESTAKQHRKELVCYAVGFTGRVSQFKYSIGKLNRRGYDVLAFEYDNDILLKGNPQLVLDAIEYIVDQTSDKAEGYESVICMGVSLGAFIAFNVQRQLPLASIGAYATAGIAVSEGIFWMKAFEPVKDAFLKNGFTQEKLAEVWQDVEIADKDPLLQDKSLVIVNGRVDRVVDHRKATVQMGRWKRDGVPVKMYKKQLMGHTMTILWYIFNTDKMLDRALSNHSKAISAKA